MDNRLSRDEHKTGLSLSELVVVTSVALVLAAILLPAIAGRDPERAKTILNSTDTLVVFDGIVKSSTNGNRSGRVKQRDEREIQSAANIDTASPVIVDEDTPYEVAGMERLLTTDIRTRRP